MISQNKIIFGAKGLMLEQWHSIHVALGSAVNLSRRAVTQNKNQMVLVNGLQFLQRFSTSNGNKVRLKLTDNYAVISPF